MFVMGEHHRGPWDIVMIEQLPGDARVFAGEHIDLFEDAYRAKADVFEIADRCRN